MQPATTDKQQMAAAEIDAVLAEIDAHPWPEEVPAARLVYDEMGPPIAPDVVLEHVDLNGVRLTTLTPPACDPDRVVLFAHGGGYAYGSLASHGGMTAEIARAAGSACVQFDYRLAPEHPYPAALDDAVAAYEWLLGRGYDPERISFVGDSAGGGLVLATMVVLAGRSRPLPGAAVCISPWVDMLARGESYDSRQALDPMIDRPLVGFLARIYLDGHDPTDPTVSPINATMQGFPPLLVQVGSREVLFSEAESLAARARRFGVDVTFEVWPEMIHVWHLFYPTLRAGREAIARIGMFLRDRTAATAGRTTR